MPSLDFSSTHDFSFRKLFLKKRKGPLLKTCGNGLQAPFMCLFAAHYIHDCGGLFALAGWPHCANYCLKSLILIQYMPKNPGASLLPKKRPLQERSTASHRACNAEALIEDYLRLIGDYLGLLGDYSILFGAAW